MKTGKVEGLVGFLRDGGYDELITFAGNVTNVGFDITPVLQEHGIASTLLVVDDPPMTPEAREHHFAEIRSDVRLSTGSYATAARAAAAAYVAGRRAGRKPLVVLPGVSHPSAVLGNTRGMLELAELVPLCERVYDTNGVSIDPIFGGKTWSAMEAAQAAGLAEGPAMFWPVSRSV